jgi:hypothetical protein
VVVDSAGVVYVADTSNHRIRLVANGQVSTLSGDGTPGFSDGPVATAQFNSPAGLALDSAGVLYVADAGNHRIRVVAGGQVSTLAGDGTAGFLDGPAPDAQLNSPWGLALDSTGALHVADAGNHRIRIVAGGQVTTLAGTGVAGFLDGPAGQAQLSSPSGVAVEGSTVYVADAGNHRVRIVAGGLVTTLAGDGTAGFLDGPAGQARFNAPTGVALVGPKMLLVGDRLGHRVRMVRAP